MNALEKIVFDLQAKSSPKRAEITKCFFKTGVGEYSHNDEFIGIRVPEIRALVHKHQPVSIVDLEVLLQHPIHEYRAFALFALVQRFQRASKQKNHEEQLSIYNLYRTHMDHVNNWDLVDSSAHQIVGAYLLDKPRDILYTWTASNNLWHRRIAIVGTYAFIKANDFVDTIAISKALLGDKEDLMHKAVGWMLREKGKKNISVLLEFLDSTHRSMPRTMLRYAIEKLDAPTRTKYMHK